MLTTLLQLDPEAVEMAAEAAARAAEIVPQEETLSIIDLAIKGGWLMIVLLLLSLIAIYIFGSKWWMIRKASQIDCFRIQL